MTAAKKSLQIQTGVWVKQPEQVAGSGVWGERGLLAQEYMNSSTSIPSPFPH